MINDNEFTILENYLVKIPAIGSQIDKGFNDDGLWWVKFSINIKDPLAWNVVQELGYVLNYLSLSQRLPTLFMPISPPPYMNGGPEEYLSWVIKSKSRDFSPDICVKWLEGRLPIPVDDISQWEFDK
ncbi:MAG: hypothetical protein GY943_01220 [Chloroflexi bacterium]|nr:hypothetical protein [Chloroflexota bacterium]